MKSLYSCVTNYILLFKAVIEEYRAVSKEIEKANDIVIIGGGPTGVEIAGEIAEKYKTKKIAIIQSNDILGGQELTPKFQSTLKEGLENINVELHLGERVSNLDELSFGICKKQTVNTSKVNYKRYLTENYKLS